MGRAGARPNSIDLNSQKRIFARAEASSNSIKLLFFLPIAFLLLFASSGCSDYTFSDADDDRKPRYVVYQGGDCNSGGFNITAGTLPVDHTKYIRTQMPVLKTPPTCSGGAGTNKIFSFWQVTDSGSDGEHPPGASVPFHRYTKTLTATAMWQCLRETYELNGGSGTIVATCKNPNDSYSLSNVTPTKAKYKFKGWLKQGTTTPLLNASAAMTAAADPMPILIAQWERVISGLQIVGTTDIPGFMEKGDTITLKAQITDPTDGSQANHSINWAAVGCTVTPATSTGHTNVSSATAVTVTFNTNGICTLTAKAADGGTAGNNPANVVKEIHVSTFSIADEMKSVPSSTNPITFPTGVNDSGTGTIPANHKFAMGKTEVTYELWKKVYDWANNPDSGCNAATGEKCYRFANAGQMGSESGGTGMTPQHPVTEINWRDLIVWCNAFTEWYNTNKGGNLAVVYKNSGGTILRNSTQAVENDVGDTFDPTTNTNTGFRLPTSAEWEFAARLRNDTTNTVSGQNVAIGGTTYYFTKGDSASGAAANANDAAETAKVAWYNSNDGNGSKEVSTKLANTLGIHDMSGNVMEWVFDKNITIPADRLIRGGTFGTGGPSIFLGTTTTFAVNYKTRAIGFRFARTLP